jgi:hypothetical protein
MQKWQYLTVDTQNTIQTSFTVVGAHGNESAEGIEITDYLPILGKHGWELVCSHRLEAALFGVGERFFFKRLKEEK